MAFLWLLVLLGMFWMHTWADYCLQGVCLADLKCKAWWEKQPGFHSKYENDYKVALMMHSIQWTGAVLAPLVPLIFYCFDITNEALVLSFCAIFIINMLVHYLIDDIKANRLITNLVQDQLFHVFQIVFTWMYFIAFLNWM